MDKLVVKDGFLFLFELSFGGDYKNDGEEKFELKKVEWFEGN